MKSNLNTNEQYLLFFLISIALKFNKETIDTIYRFLKENPKLEPQLMPRICWCIKCGDLFLKENNSRSFKCIWCQK